MNNRIDNEGVDRRTFLKMSSFAAAVTTAGGAMAGDEPGKSRGGKPAYRVLGRTGLDLTVVSLGAMRTKEPEVLQAAFDAGVNYIDTAHCYMNGMNEKIVGMALKGYRDKVLVATKCHMVSPKEEIIKSVEGSLRSLQTDYVDVLQTHHPSVDDVLHEDAKEALAKLKKDGKIRFAGTTTHSREAEILDAVTNDPDKFYDMVLVTYNYKSKAEVGAAIERAAKAGIGIIAMKTQAKTGYDTKEFGDIRPHQAALRWVLQNPNVTAAIPAMVDLNEVKEDTAVMYMDMKMARDEISELDRYAAAVDSRYCHRCGECIETCPFGADIPTINRSLMYAEGYGDFQLAEATHAGIPAQCSVAACLNCSRCVAQCVNGVDLPRQMRKARALFA